MSRYALGLDYGTESARAILVDVATGEVAAAAVQAYPDGVIDRALPGSDEPLPADWALQNPSDWLIALEVIVPAVLSHSGITPKQVIGIGLDFTSCTILPTLNDGTPLCTVEGFRLQPHAWPKLWKHHAAQRQADRLNRLALARNEGWLERYGGKISSEWLVPKVLEILEEAPDIYSAASCIVEGADWVVWQLTGRLVRNACAAGYKAMWHKTDGFPSRAFLAELHPGLVDLYDRKVGGPIAAPGTIVGELTPHWAGRLGLAEGTPVSAPIIDAHAAVIGGGICGPAALFMIMGTSTCHMLMAEDEVPVEGISGVVEDGIVAGLFGYESGQAAVGDIFAWFVENSVPPAYHEEAAIRGATVHQVLSEKAAAIFPGRSGLLALDWWNGCRTPLVDANLSGAVFGYTLQTKPEAVYRALMEATAYGTRLIVETLSGAGLPITSVRAGGGLTKNDLLIQIYATVLGLPIEVSAVDQASALGAAILGAVAGGAFANVQDAVESMVPPPSATVFPVGNQVEPYNLLFAEYGHLVDLFGRNAQSMLKRLRTLQSL